MDKKAAMQLVAEYLAKKHDEHSMELELSGAAPVPFKIEEYPPFFVVHVQSAEYVNAVRHGEDDFEAFEHAITGDTRVFVVKDSGEIIRCPGSLPNETYLEMYRICGTLFAERTSTVLVFDLGANLDTEAKAAIEGFLESDINWSTEAKIRCDRVPIAVVNFSSRAAARKATQLLLAMGAICRRAYDAESASYDAESCSAKSIHVKEDWLDESSSYV